MFHYRRPEAYSFVRAVRWYISDRLGLDGGQPSSMVKPQRTCERQALEHTETLLLSLGLS